MARRGENIYKRKDGRWEGRYIKERNTQGKIKYGYVYHEKYNGVKQKLIYFKAIYQQNRHTNLYNETTKVWLNQWLSQEVKKKVKDSTFASYHYKVQHYIIPYIGEEPLQKLTESTIQQWVDKLAARNLSGNTIKLVIQILRMSIKSAQKKLILWADPTVDVCLPRVRKKKVYALSVKDQKKVEKEAIKGVEGISILLSLYTGLRIGEISALKWSDIDFTRQLIHVERTMQRIPIKTKTSLTQLIVQEAKTLGSIRSIPFSNQLKAQLLSVREKTQSEFVCATKQKALEPRSITYHFKKIMSKLKLSHINFHQLRHTFATRALEIGGDIASISSLLGHQSTKFTFDVYVDSLFHQRKKITQKIEKVYFSSSK